MALFSPMCICLPGLWEVCCLSVVICVKHNGCFLIVWFWHMIFPRSGGLLMVFGLFWHIGLILEEPSLGLFILRFSFVHLSYVTYLLCFICSNFFRFFCLLFFDIYFISSYFTQGISHNNLLSISKQSLTSLRGPPLLDRIMQQQIQMLWQMQPSMAKRQEGASI